MPKDWEDLATCSHSSSRYWVLGPFITSSPLFPITARNLELQAHLILQFWHPRKKRKLRDQGLETVAVNPNHQAAFWTWHIASANMKSALLPHGLGNLSPSAFCIFCWHSASLFVDWEVWNYGHQDLVPLLKSLCARPQHVTGPLFCDIDCSVICTIGLAWKAKMVCAVKPC